MTTKTMMKDLDKLYKRLEDETSSHGMDIVAELVDLEIRLEQECNQ